MIKKTLVALLGGVCLLVLVSCGGSDQPAACDSKLAWSVVEKVLRNKLYSIVPAHEVDYFMKDPKKYFEIVEVEYNDAIKARRCLVRSKKAKWIVLMQFWLNRAEDGKTYYSSIP